MSLLPPVATPAERWSRSILLATCVAGVPAALVAGSWLNRPSYLLLAPLAVAAVTVVHAVMTVRARRLLRRVDFLVCPQCLYPLAGVTLADRCPECGASLSASQVKATWQRCYGLDYSQRP